MSEKIIDIFNIDSSQNKQANNSQNSDKNEEENDLLYNQDRIQTKLSLRKKKIEEILSSKRNINIMDTFQAFNTSINSDFISSEHEIIPYSKSDFTSGDLYIKLKAYFESKDIDNIREIINNLVIFFNQKKLDNIEMKELYMKSGINVNNKEKFPFANLLFNIGVNTEDKIIYVYCFNFMLNFSFISDEFCKSLVEEKKIDLILEKLSYFYPIFKETNLIENIEDNNSDTKNDATLIESYFFGSQIFKLLGNIYISSDNFEQFEINNFYDKIFYLITEFTFEQNNYKHKKIYFDYLETLLWLILLFEQKEENFIKNYQDKLLGIIPYLFADIKMLYYTNDTNLLDRILEVLEILSDISKDFQAQMVDAEGIKILTHLFGYLFDNNNDNNINDIELNSDNIIKIINIFINIFCLDTKYFEYFDDYSDFALVIETLISRYKMQGKNHFDIQDRLTKLMANLACFFDINEIIHKLIINNNIIRDLFKFYNPLHKKEIILFIDNIIETQNKHTIKFILDSGAFEIIKNNICNYNDNNSELLKKTIIAFYKLIQKEKSGNIRLLFEKIYNTAIPDKIKELVSNNCMDKDEDEKKLKSIVNDFEIYENSLNYD